MAECWKPECSCHIRKSAEWIEEEKEKLLKEIKIVFSLEEILEKSKNFEDSTELAKHLCFYKKEDIINIWKEVCKIDEDKAVTWTTSFSKNAPELFWEILR